MTDCDHHWVSTHQRDFPTEVYWVQQCSLCGVINGPELGRSIKNWQQGRDGSWVPAKEIHPSWWVRLELWWHRRKR